MTAWPALSLLFGGSLAAGFLGSLSGLGGGLVIVPLIVLGLSGSIYYAIGTSLVAVIATSTASSAAYVREGFTNVRVAIFLETATTVGALCGVAVSALISTTILSLVFGSYLIYSAISSLSRYADGTTLPADKLATYLELNSTYPEAGKLKSYYPQRVLWGYVIMFFAGLLSGLLGLGSGVLKVLALDKMMKLPFKVSTTTSNFMIGVTAAASAGIYFSMGYIDPFLTFPVVLGVTIGSFAGARLLPHIHTKFLRLLFAALVIFIALEMFVEALR